MTKTKTKTKTKARVAGDRAQSGLSLDAFAVEEAKYVRRLHDNFHLILAVTDELLAPDGGPAMPPTVILEPPAEGGDRLAEEIAGVLEFQALRNSGAPEAAARLQEAVDQADDIITPLFASFVNAAGIPSGLLRLASLMETAGHFIVAHFKEKFRRTRPFLADARINPAITVPNHASYPSGHSLQSHLVAFALIDVTGDNGQLSADFIDTAARIAENREFLGVHYRSDSESGELIARLVFPVLRTIFWDVFDAAVEDWSARSDADGPFSRRQAALRRYGEATAGGEAHLPASWHLTAIGLGAEDVGRAGGVSHPVVAVIDTGIDVGHPDLVDDNGRSVVLKERRFNTDFPAPERECTAFGSSGTGHGTAMAGIIAGQGRHAPSGVARSARISAARIQTLLNDSHESRLTLASLVLNMLLLEDARPCVFLVGPDFRHPEPGEFLSRAELLAMAATLPKEIGTPAFLKAAWAAYGQSEKPICDPFLLALLLVSDVVPVVIPAGNDGTSALSYPGNPQDYARLLQAIWPGERQAETEADFARLTALCRLFAHFLLFEAAYGDFDTALEEAGQTGTLPFGSNVVGHLGRSVLRRADMAFGSDPFAVTGITVVGAGVPEDPAGGGAKVLRRAAYSQYGPGLALLAPSGGDLPLAARPARPDPGSPLTYGGSVAAPDLFGHAGFAADPGALSSSTAEPAGFGGTSAAAAIVTGMIARLVESGRIDPRAGGAEARKEILRRWHAADRASVPWKGKLCFAKGDLG